MLSAQNEEFRVASEAGAQGGRLAADLTVARWDAALEPQIRLAIELVLQMMSERLLRRVVARALERTVARTSGTLSLDHDCVPFAGLRADFAFARGKHVCAFCFQNRDRGKARLGPVMLLGWRCGGEERAETAQDTGIVKAKESRADLTVARRTRRRLRFALASLARVRNAPGRPGMRFRKEPRCLPGCVDAA
jgi:hypothetical protein